MTRFIASLLVCIACGDSAADPNGALIAIQHEDLSPSEVEVLTLDVRDVRGSLLVGMPSPPRSTTELYIPVDVTRAETVQVIVRAEGAGRVNTGTVDVQLLPNTLVRTNLALDEFVESDCTIGERRCEGAEGERQVIECVSVEGAGVERVTERCEAGATCEAGACQDPLIDPCEADRFAEGCCTPTWRGAPESYGIDVQRFAADGDLLARLYRSGDELRLATSRFASSTSLAVELDDVRLAENVNEDIGAEEMDLIVRGNEIFAFAANRPATTSSLRYWQLSPTLAELSRGVLRADLDDIPRVRAQFTDEGEVLAYSAARSGEAVGTSVQRFEREFMTWSAPSVASASARLRATGSVADEHYLVVADEGQTQVLRMDGARWPMVRAYETEAAVAAITEFEAAPALTLMVRIDASPRVFAGRPLEGAGLSAVGEATAAAANTLALDALYTAVLETAPPPSVTRVYRSLDGTNWRVLPDVASATFRTPGLPQLVALGGELNVFAASATEVRRFTLLCE